MIVDAHVHTWSAASNLAADRTYTPPAAPPVDTLLGLMDDHGVDVAVLVQPSFLGTDNGYLLDAIRRWPDRFRGVAVVDPAISVDAVEDLRSAGIAGLRLNIASSGIAPDLESDRYRSLFERAVRAGLHIQLHLDGPGLPGVLPPVLEAGCRIVIDHFGRPDPAKGMNCSGWAAMRDLAGQGDHVVKLSGPYRLGGLDPAPLARDLLSTFGPDRLVWGSDFPWTRFEDGRSYAQCRQWLDDWVPCPDDRAGILGAAAVDLYGIKR